jgi:WD40 repeat protein
MRGLGFVSIWIFLCLGLVPPAAATDLTSMAPDDIRALQQRLTDANCYTGPISGTASAAVADAVKACPLMDPMLSIETGMHTAVIRKIGMDRDCRIMATGSDDKTARLWSLPDGRLLRTLRVPIGTGDNGKVDSVGVSPDGRLVAVGGWDPHYDIDKRMAVYLFDAVTGTLRARIGSFESVIDHLTFSQDGRYLAATLGDKGVRVIDVVQNAVIASDTDYGTDSYSAAFAPDGRLFTVSWDGYLRAYDTSFRLVKKVKTLGGTQPNDVSVDPNGKLLAIGYNDTKAVEVYRASDLGREYAADTSIISDTAEMSTLTWSRDGRKLLAGGTHWHQDAYSVAVWERPGPGRSPVLQKIYANTIMSVLPCTGGFGFGTADPAFGLLDQNGKMTFSKRSVPADVRDMGEGFRVSNDGGQVRFGLEPFAKRPMLFDVSRATLDTSGERPDLAAPRQTGLNVTDWTTRSPKFNGKVLPLDQNETSGSLAISSDQKRFVLGAGFGVRAYDTQGTMLWRKSVPATTRAVNLTPDGRLVIAAFGDGTVRWYRLSDGQELLALFVNRDDLRWVAWTPSGYYMASPGGEDMIGWTLNRGWEQAADFFAASRFRERFSRADIVQQVLVTLDEGKAVEAANRAANIKTDNSSAASKLPPVIKIISPADGTLVRDKDITVEYELRSPSGLPVDSVEVMIDGHPTRGFARTDTVVNGAKIERLTINVPAGDTELGLLPRSGTLAGEVAKVKLRWAGQVDAAADDRFKPKLYGVVVGVSNYVNPALKLKYAAKDAKDFAAALQAQKGGLYRDVELTVLTDAEATNAAVRRALTWLKRSVTSRDVGIVFLAGHGQSDANRYYYLTADADLNQLEDTALDGVTLRDRTRLASKVLVFLDTCYAGQAMGSTTRGVTDINAIVNDLSSTENGVTTYASSTGREVSMEDPAWGNGAFTKALIEGLGTLGKAKADMGGKGVITTASLDFWISERVKELTHGSQHPVMTRPATVPDFPMFVVK